LPAFQPGDTGLLGAYQFGQLRLGQPAHDSQAGNLMGRLKLFVGLP
jgi:hypothetical protein